ncbi:MAG: hypothetical protein ACFCU8_03020 [Thermosynechococcaceae cyanobacterium]
MLLTILAQGALAEVPGAEPSPEVASQKNLAMLGRLAPVAGPLPVDAPAQIKQRRPCQGQ